MDRKKLRLDALDVTSFDVTTAFGSSGYGLNYQAATLVQNQNEPTENTFCEICDDTVDNCPNQMVLG
jgi:hypothetical protein